MNDEHSNPLAGFKTHAVRTKETPAGEDAPDRKLSAAEPEAQDKAAGDLEAKRPRAGDPDTWPKEVGGPEGPEPTRYGDWERNGICSDF